MEVNKEDRAFRLFGRNVFSFLQDERFTKHYLEKYG